MDDKGNMGESKELKKHAAAIHCSNALTLMQRKISNALLFNAYSDLLRKEEHCISIAQLCKLLGTTTHNHDALKNALKALVQTMLEWNLVDDKTGKEDWSATTILASVSLKGGLCYYAYSPRMKELLYSPSIYGKINLIVQSRFRSSYGLALYENCIRYRGLPGTKTFELEDFRKLMGIPDSQYKIFRDFKRRVIDKAVEEVNTHADIFIEPSYKRAGRQVVGIRFMIKERAKKLRITPEKLNKKNENISTERNIIVHQLEKEFGVDRDLAETLSKKHCTEYIQEKIQLVLTSNAFKLRKINDLAGYIVSAINKDFKGPKTPEKSVADRKAREYNSSLAESNRQKELEAQKNRYAEQVKRHIFGFLTSLEPLQKSRVIEEWLKSLEKENDFARNKITRLYNETEFDHPWVRGSLKKFLSTVYTGKYEDMISFEEFSLKEELVD